MQDLPGSVYLYALATVSITFVGFAALLIVIRSAVGRELTRYDTYFTLSFIQIGFIVIPIIWFVAHVPSRRKAAYLMALHVISPSIAKTPE